MDTRDIEATLYAMVHHSVSNLPENQINLSPFGTQPNQLRPNFMLGNMFQNSQASFNLGQPRNMAETRYWRHTTSTNSNFEFNNRQIHNHRAVMGFTQRITNQPNNIPSGNRPRIFNSYTPYISYLNNSNGQNNDRHFGNLSQNNKNQGNFNNRNNNRNNQNSRQNPSLSKEQRIGKYVAKKQRIDTIKKKGDLNKLNNVVIPSAKTYAANIIPKETVVLSSSEDSDNDDEAVIEIPLPSPPMVCIDDSDNEDETNLFVTPNVPSCSGSQKHRSERPCSPTSSVISDDFIIQNDRSRVITENINITEDDELQCRQPTVGSLLDKSNVENPTSNEVNSIEETPLDVEGADLLQTKDDNFVAPTNITSYQVADSSIRETDVYESAESSDIPESIYNRLAPNNDKAKQNQDDSNESNIIDTSSNENRIKRLHKRKSSGSNKSSEYASSNEDDEQDEHLSIVNRSKTSTPYIVRGSAVDFHGKDTKLSAPRMKNKQKRQKFNSINQSDDDFISTLSNICCSENEKDDSPQDITAKDLIANVDLSNEQTKNNLDADSMEMEQDVGVNTNVTNMSKEDVVTAAEEIIPNDSVVSVIEDNINSKMPKKRKKISLVDESNDDEIGWNTEMRNFYNESWGGENFDLIEIQSKMKGSASLWRIRNDDKFPIERHGKLNKVRCLNCSELGHIRARCPQPRKGMLCRMCGSQEHKEPRCTNKICLKCGTPNIVFSAACNQCRFQVNSRCNVCRQKGHISLHCPDSWRRYHSTTSDNTPLQTKVEYSQVKYCPICGEKGHWAESCDNAVRFLDAPPPTCRIINHTPSYPINKNAPKNNSSNKNLFKASLVKEPQAEVMIKLQKYVSLDKKTYYGRFVNAIENQAKEKKIKRKMKKMNNMLLNPFSKFSKPATIGNVSNIENFSFSEEMQKLNKTQTDTNQKFKLDFITPNKPDDSLPSTSSNAFSNKSLIAVAEEKSDSNYSFSEFYEKGEEPNKEPPKEIINKHDPILKEFPKKIGRNDHMVERDYISLTLNEDEDNTMSKIQDPSDESHIVLNESVEPSTSEEKCTAKMYLSKQDSQLLLSSSGQDIISSLCNKHKVIVKMEWQSRGNVLNITGLPEEQNLFHSDFVNYIQDARKEQKRKQLEQSLQVPKHKKPLIKFIDNLFAMLKINLGDVNQVYRKMTFNETLKSKNGQKMADRSRRVLNMILFGQTGLREGKQHLDALKNIASQLKNENEDIPITNEFRNELFRHVKYIFTPFEHPNYNSAIEEYYNLKYISTEEENKSETHLKPNPLAIVNIIDKPSISIAKEANIELPENIIASDAWSLKCKDLVDQCRTLLEKDECSAKIIGKLDRVYEKAMKKELNYLDYQALQKIMNKIQAKSNLVT